MMLNSPIPGLREAAPLNSFGASAFHSWLSRLITNISKKSFWNSKIERSVSPG